MIHHYRIHALRGVDFNTTPFPTTSLKIPLSMRLGP